MSFTRIALICAAIAAVVLALTPANADPWKQIEEGRLAVARDDHGAAIAAFRLAAEEDPALGDTVAVALASQLTWIGRYDEAIAEFTRYLERHPRQIDAMMTLALAQSWSNRVKDALGTYRRVVALEPDNRDAAFGAARMLSWSGQLDASIRAYDALLKREPDFTDAAVARAHVVNWRGDHRRAAGLFTEVLQTQPASPPALEGRAAAWNWAGRPDRALADLAEVKRQGPTGRDAIGLERAIRMAWSPGATVGVDLSRDSDSFQNLTTRLDEEIPVALRARVHVSMVRGSYEKPKRPTVEDLWVGLNGEARLSDAFMVYGNGQLLAHRPTGVSGTRGTGDAHLAWLPHDRIRVDAGYGRAGIFTYERSPDGTARYVDADLFDLGVSVRPYWRSTLTLTLDRGFYSDGNERLNARARIRQTLLSKPRLCFEVGGQWLNFEKDLDRGLWTPRGFRSYLVAPEAEWNPRPWILLFGRIDMGHAGDRASKVIPYLTSSAGIRIERGVLRFELRGGRADSNVETGRGYRRSFASLLLRVRL